MKSIAKHTANLLLILLFSMISKGIGICQLDNNVFGKDVRELIHLKQDIQKKVAIILHISKNISEDQYSQVETANRFVKVINNDCGLFESQFDTDFAIVNSRLNDEFEVLDEEDDWYQVKMNDGRKAWISRSCVQEVVKNQGRKTGRLKNINNRNDQVQLANFLIEEIKVLVTDLENKASKRLSQKRTTSEEAKVLVELRRSVKQYLALSESAYLLYVIPESDKKTFADFLSNVSFLAELQLGASDFTMVVNENDQVSQRGAIGEFLIDLAYQLDDKSAINLILSNTNDIIQTPYSVSTVDVNYNSEVKSLKWNSGISYDLYNDALNPFNNYNRLGLRVGARQKISKKSTYRVNYQLNANRYRDFENINFTNHALNLSTRTILNSTKALSLNFRGNAQTGEEERRNFFLLNPSIRYDVRSNKSSSQYFLNYQVYRFENLALRDADRLMVGVRNSKQLSNRNRALYVAMSAKLFPSKPEFSYYQFDSRLNTNWTKSKDVFSSAGIRVNYFPENTNQNFADIQLSFGNNGAIFYSVSSFNRFYYQIQPLTNIADVNVVSGFNYKQFKIGPSLSLHALINAEDFEFKTDGNFYRLGAYLESNLILPYQINLSLTASYDYGFVYSQQFEQNNTTGELTFGDVNERHPTTFQLNTLLTTSIVSNTDIFLRLNMYIIDTDITSIISRDPFERNTRFMLRLGARYRFN